MSTANTLTAEQMELVIEAADLAVWDWQVQSGELIINERWANMLGYSVEALNPISVETWESLVHPNDLKKAKWALEQYFSGKADQYQVEFRMLTREKDYYWVLSIGKIFERDDDGQPKRMLGIHFDIHHRKNNEDELSTTTKLLKESQRIAKVGGWELNIQSGDLYWTDETYRIHDTSPEEFFPTVDAGVGYFLPESKSKIIDALEAAIEKGEPYDLELETYTTKGRKIDVRTNCIVTFDKGVPAKLTGTFQDISAQKAAQRELIKANRELEIVNQQLHKHAHFDALTGLPNRALLEDRMQQSLSRALRSGQMVAVVFIDLDGFKEINDKYGHNFGDKLLCSAAKKINECLRSSDTLARYGGDEFIVLLDDLRSEEECTPVLERILQAVGEKAKIQHKAVQITASIGVTIFPKDNSNSAQLIRHADQAMYIAKNAGKNQCHIFDTDKDVASRIHEEELETIKSALSAGEFVLFYQPKVSLKSNRVVGVEALIRWNHPSEGILPPIRFLPIIEDDPLNILVGEWVIETALNQLELWSSGLNKIPISVNISSNQIQDPRFIDRLKEILKRHKRYEAGRLEFEIVETSAVNEIEQAAQVISDCEQLGISYSIDDFGTGYSSLTYLKRLPTKTLKIDRSFVQDMLNDKDDLAIVEGVIQLAKTFKQSVIAEGVETIEHGKILQKLGCDLVQGFGIAKPMPALEFEDWLKQWNAKNDWKILSNEK